MRFLCCITCLNEENQGEIMNYFVKNLFGNDKSAYFALCLK